VVRGIQCDADEKHHNSEEEEAWKKLHDYSLPIDRCGVSVAFAPMGVEISQPTRAISVATMILART
jgi:putative Mn2+ efflux pump MntP